MQKMLLITGLPRSGTSMAACLAEGLGIPMAATGDLPEPTPDLKDRYPQGNMEDMAFRSIAWAILDITYNADDRTVYNQSMRHFTRRELETFTVSQQRDLEVWAKKRFENGVQVAGVKLPVMSYFLLPLVRFLREIEIEPHVVFVHRPVEEAAASLAKKRGSRYAPDCPHEWATAVQHYNEWHVVRAENQIFAEGDVPVIDLSFLTLTQQTEACAKQLAEFCGVEYTESAVANIDRLLHVQ